MHTGVEPCDFFKSGDNLCSSYLALDARFGSQRGDAPRFNRALNIGTLLARPVARRAQIIQNRQGADFVAGVEARQGRRAPSGVAAISSTADRKVAISWA